MFTVYYTSIPAPKLNQLQHNPDPNIKYPIQWLCMQCTTLNHYNLQLHLQLQSSGAQLSYCQSSQASDREVRVRLTGSGPVLAFKNGKFQSYHSF